MDEHQRHGSIDYHHYMPPKYVCFNCRKCWKKQQSVCPQCKGKLHSIGIHFKAPRRKDIKAWKIVEELYRSGVRFNFESHSDAPMYPAYDRARQSKKPHTRWYGDRNSLAHGVTSARSMRFATQLNLNQWPGKRPRTYQQVPAFLERWKAKTLHRISLIVAAADEIGRPTPEGARGLVMLENLAKRKVLLRKKKK